MASSEIEFAWAIGLFEGEGCFTCGTNGAGNSQRRAMLGTSDLDVLQRFHKAVGGIGRINGPYIKKRQTKPMWYWTCSRWDDLLNFIDESYEMLSPRRRKAADKILALEPQGRWPKKVA